MVQKEVQSSPVSPLDALIWGNDLDAADVLVVLAVSVFRRGDGFVLGEELWPDLGAGVGGAFWGGDGGDVVYRLLVSLSLKTATVCTRSFAWLFRLLAAAAISSTSAAFCWVT